MITVGDSYISGEAGRWAGNTTFESPNAIDALGPTAYFDNNGTSEKIHGCHRSRSAEGNIGDDSFGHAVRTINLACSGARTYSFYSGGEFKPGLDWENPASQAYMLFEEAMKYPVKLVVLSIGGNNFNFGDMGQDCLTDYINSQPSAPHYCQNDAVAANFAPAAVAARTGEIRNAIENIQLMMSFAGYSQASYRILVQNYPAPLATSVNLRYPEEGGYNQAKPRQAIGGCGFWNADLNWMNGTILPSINGAVRNAVTQVGGNVRLLDLSSAFDGRRLCENTDGLLEEWGLSSWTSPVAPEVSEWVNQIHTVSTVLFPYTVQEGLHPNFWGQLALRDCLRHAYDLGGVVGGRCTRLGGMVATGLPAPFNNEPQMQFSPTG